MAFEKPTKTLSPFSWVRSFAHAVRGLVVAVRTTPSIWVQLVAFLCALALGAYLQISRVEFVLLILASGLVLVAEMINTALEIDMDLTSPEYHPHARDVKDVAAGAVLLASLFAVVVGVCIFLPHLLP